MNCKLHMHLKRKCKNKKVKNCLNNRLKMRRQSKPLPGTLQQILFLLIQDN